MSYQNISVALVQADIDAVKAAIVTINTKLSFLVTLDANERKGTRISRSASRVSAWVVPTNEELMIARHTAVLLGLVPDARTQGV